MEKVICSNSYLKFACKMADCQNSCCSEEWGVEVLQSEYDFLVKNGVNPNIFKFYTDADGERFIEIVPHEGKCPLRREDGLCKLQCDFGEADLFDTCAVFPRSHGKIGELIEASLDTACETAAELILFGGNFALVEAEINQPRYFDTEVEKKFAKKHLGGLKNYYAFRDFLFHLLFDIDLPIAEKVLLIGIFTEKCKFPMKHKKFIHKVKKWNEYTKKDFKRLLKSCTADEKFKKSFMSSLYALFLTQNENSFEFSQIELPAPEFVDNALTNFVANHIFSEKYPFSMLCKKQSPREVFRRFALSFAFLKFILKSTPDLTREKMCKTVCYYTRNVDHDVSFIDDALEKMEEFGASDLALFSALIL